VIRLNIGVIPDTALSQLTVAEKDALILSLLPFVGQLDAVLAWIAELEAPLAWHERPPKTLDNSSLPPSKGRKSKGSPTSKKPPRKSRRGFGRALHANPDLTVDSQRDAWLHCHAAWPSEQTVNGHRNIQRWAAEVPHFVSLQSRP